MEDRPAEKGNGNGNGSEPVTEKRALVIGGGIAGIQAALDLANARVRVTLVEKGPSLGGRMAQLDKTFPTMDCSI
jgi:heterodisulfide reductase subunit A